MRLRVNPEDFTTKTVSYIEPSIKETEEEKQNEQGCNNEYFLSKKNNIIRM